MICKECGRRPAEIPEYVSASEMEGVTPDEFVIANEGTYNPENGLFYCPECHLTSGMPEGRATE